MSSGLESGPSPGFAAGTCALQGAPFGLWLRVAGRRWSPGRATFPDAAALGLALY